MAVVAAWTYCWSCWEGEETRPSKQPRRCLRGEKKEEEGKDWKALVCAGAVVVVAVAGVRPASRVQTIKERRAKEAEEDKTHSRAAPPRVIGRVVSLSLGGRRRPVYVCMCVCVCMCINVDEEMTAHTSTCQT